MSSPRPIDVTTKRVEDDDVAKSVEDSDVAKRIVHRDVAKWVEPVGAGKRLEEDEKPVRKVAVIGTGDFGRALAAKMVQAGYKVKLGSRNPDRNR